MHADSKGIGLQVLFDIRGFTLGVNGANESEIVYIPPGMLYVREAANAGRFQEQHYLTRWAGILVPIHKLL